MRSLRPHRNRELTRHEIDLWLFATRDVRKFRAPLPEAEAVAPSEPVPPKPLSSPKIAKSVVTAPEPKPVVRHAPPLAPIEPKLKRRLARGRSSVDAVLDLHGMTQERAHHAVHGFLESAYFSGARIVLIVTGKGSLQDRDGHDHFRRTGVLRQIVPHWLREASVRKIVMGFEEAAPSQGGYGALYVRIRRSDKHPAGLDGR